MCNNSKNMCSHSEPFLNSLLNHPKPVPDDFIPSGRCWVDLGSPGLLYGSGLVPCPLGCSDGACPPGTRPEPTGARFLPRTASSHGNLEDIVFISLVLYDLCCVYYIDVCLVLNMVLCWYYVALSHFKPFQTHL